MATAGGANASRSDTSRVVRVVGPGRAGSSVLSGLEKAGWRPLPLLGRSDDVRRAAAGVDLLVLATPDAGIAEVAASVEPSPSTVVAHLSGAHGLEVLAPHPRRGAFHPLRSIPTPTTDLAGAWFAIAGDPLVRSVVHDLGGRSVVVADDQRVAYHTAAVIASNHLVALLGQVARVAALAGVPLEAFIDLARGTLDNVEALGPHAALTGPVARGDWATVERHRSALAPEERAAYDALCALAARLADEAGSG